MNQSKDILLEMDKYFKETELNLEDDLVTHKIIRQYYQEQGLIKNWSSIITDESSLPEIKKNADKKNKPKLLRTRTLIGVLAGIAASVLLLVVFPIDQQTPLDKLLASHYEVPYNRDILKGPVENDDLRRKAYSLYREKKFKAAAPLFLQATLLPDQSDADHFFLGLSYLYSSHPEKAISHLRSIADKPASLYKDSAIWYTGLALLDSKELTEAKQYLNQVASWNSNQGKRNLASKAQKILETI